MESNFVWDDENVRHFAEWYRRTQGNPSADIWGKDLLEVYKATKQVKSDYEILSFSGGNPDYIFLKGYDGFFRCDKFYHQEDKWRLDDLLNHQSKTYPIHSVKRLSDNCVFSIGDKLQRMDTDNIIKEFWKDFNGNSIWVCTNTKMRYGCSLYVAEKVKEPVVLFITEDGVSIFDKTPVWIVFKDWTMKSGVASPNPNIMEYLYNPTLLKYFSTKEAAQRYIFEEKNTLCYNDVRDFVRDNWDGWKIDLKLEKLEQLVQSKL